MHLKVNGQTLLKSTLLLLQMKYNTFFVRLNFD